MTSLRDAFFGALYPIADADDRICVVTADMGAPSLDRFWANLPKQFFQVGIAEAQAVNLAAGLAREGRLPYVYGIAPFVTGRAYEQVKLNVADPDLPVVVLGAGAGFSYSDAGPSHHAIDDVGLMRMLPNMTIWSPSDPETAAAIARYSIGAGPAYVRFDREARESGPTPFLATENKIPIYGVYDWGNGTTASVTIYATGSTVSVALEAARLLSLKIRVAVVEMIRLKPIPTGFGCHSKPVVVVEEHLASCGLGAAIAEAYPFDRVLRIGVPDTFTHECGSRDFLRRKYGIDAASVARRIEEWLT